MGIDNKSIPSLVGAISCLATGLERATADRIMTSMPGPRQVGSASGIDWAVQRCRLIGANEKQALAAHVDHCSRSSYKDTSIWCFVL